MNIVLRIINIILLLLVLKTGFTGKPVFLPSKDTISIVIIKNDYKPPAVFNYTIKTAQITDDILHVHIIPERKNIIDYKLIWNGLYYKTYPPKVTLFIRPVYSQKSNKNLLSTDHNLYFNLTPLQRNDSIKVGIQLLNYQELLMYSY